MMTKGQKKVGKVTSSGKTVKSPKQAMAIALSTAKLPMRGQRTAKNKARK
jgi:hypothetical protein